VYWDLSQNLVGNYDGVQINYVSEAILNAGVWNEEEEIELIVDFRNSLSRDLDIEIEIALEEAVYHANTFLLEKNLQGGLQHVA